MLHLIYLIYLKICRFIHDLQHRYYFFVYLTTKNNIQYVVLSDMHYVKINVEPGIQGSEFVIESLPYTINEKFMLKNIFIENDESF